MIRRLGQNRSFLVFLGALVAAVTLAACGDRLDSGTTCTITSALCPQPVSKVRDTIIPATEVIATDTTVLGYPPVGQETVLLLASRGDSLDARMILRFDTLPSAYRAANATQDSAITAIDTATLSLRTAAVIVTPTAPVTIEVYDVAIDGADTSTATLGSLFTPDRLITSRTIAPDSVASDTVYIPLPPAVVLSHVLAHSHFRLGLRARSSESVHIAYGSLQSGANAFIRLKLPDTTASPIDVAPESKTPDAPEYLKAALGDYNIFVRGAPPPPDALIEVGGLPGRRTYFRFNLPHAITDSSKIIRATLLLTQRPNRSSPAAYVSATVNAQAVLASTVVTDIPRQLRFLGTRVVDSAVVMPADSGLRSFEMDTLVNGWIVQDSTTTPRALGLRMTGEGLQAGLIQFFSSRAADPELRPRLRLTYIDKKNLGLP